MMREIRNIEDAVSNLYLTGDEKDYSTWKHLTVRGHKVTYSLKKFTYGTLTDDFYYGYLFYLTADTEAEGEPKEITLREEAFLEAYKNKFYLVRREKEEQERREIVKAVEAMKAAREEMKQEELEKKKENRNIVCVSVILGLTILYTLFSLMQQALAALKYFNG